MPGSDTHRAQVAGLASIAIYFVVAALLLLPARTSPLRVRVLSGQPDMVTGGSALVAVAAPASVRLNWRDVSSAFRPSGEAFVGLVTGLRPGRNRVEASSGDGYGAIELLNHPTSGPVFSGPHQTPFLCQTVEAGLGEPADGGCSAATKVTYYYRPARPLQPPPDRPRAAIAGVPPGYLVFDGAQPVPDKEIETVTTTEGHVVPFIVRREVGVINRAIYAISFLHRPGDPLPDPWTKAPGWNGRLVYSFGGSCNAGYRQGLPPGGLDTNSLARGYAHAASSLNVFGNNCDDVISAETLMMVKEYFAKTFGPPVFTIGSGGSGGSMQQTLIAQNYPGLLDALIPAASYPDLATLMAPVADCTLLAEAFGSSTETWTDAQKTAVSGFATWATCESWRRSYSPRWQRPDACHATVPEHMRYHPVRNPRGIRCTINDNQSNVYGRDPVTGFAPQHFDNTGVQYGLLAFEAGVISAEQFVQLNERAGGFSIDGDRVDARTAADPHALRTAYRTGRVVRGGGHVPMLDMRNYLDPKGDIHDRVRSFVMRARLLRDGGAGNHVILTNARGVAPVEIAAAWLERAAADTAPGTAAEKIARNRPPELVDACWTADGERIPENVEYPGTGRCGELYRAFGDPRIAAGAPLTNDVLKCRLKPLSAADYKHPLTPTQSRRLQAVFPEGVCDYSLSGVGQELKPRPWIRY
ncbi:MAG: hypothetical protein IPM24_23985 [Bryobacterales bacterium]|nr:hypothetical protein [Bryobacterales bacterium]